MTPILPVHPEVQAAAERLAHQERPEVRVRPARKVRLAILAAPGRPEVLDRQEHLEVAKITTKGMETVPARMIRTIRAKAKGKEERRNEISQVR